MDNITQINQRVSVFNLWLNIAQVNKVFAFRIQISIYLVAFWNYGW